MTAAYFDCYSGISGDMTLGAMVDLGVPIYDLRSALASLPIKGYTINAEHVTRCGVGATQVKVTTEERHPHRHFSHIKEIIEGSQFSARVKERAVEAFHKIAVAEAAVHETTIENIHFHEVGAVDAIVDIVGAMWCLDRLEISEVTASSVAVGSGTVRAAHGVMPVPAPATARLLEGVPIVMGDVTGELTTPTGAAILTTITSNFSGMDNFSISKTGYGAGTREYAKHTNYLRVMLGEKATAGLRLPLEKRALVVLSAEIDDMPVEIFGHVLEKLFEAGCLDAHTSPAQMKKNRPGTTLTVLSDPQQMVKFIELILRETTTFGVRVVKCDRYCLVRRFEKIETPLGPVIVKVGMWGSETLKVTAEYEECKRIAAERGMPLTEVFAIVNAAIQGWKSI